MQTYKWLKLGEMKPIKKAEICNFALYTFLVAFSKYLSANVDVFHPNLLICLQGKLHQSYY